MVIPRLQEVLGTVIPRLLEVPVLLSVGLPLGCLASLFRGLPLDCLVASLSWVLPRVLGRLLCVFLGLRCPTDISFINDNQFYSVFVVLTLLPSLSLQRS